ncbi:MAG: hypothetical protein OSJ70_10210 [Bacilli bacterium]|nr:hypothetical protein [Bacilli bacterium]
MDTFLNFLSDNTFFAIFSGVIIVLVLAFIVTLIKGKKEDKKTIEDVTEDNYLVNQQEMATSENLVPDMDSSFNYSATIENQMMGSNSEATGYQAAFTNYVPDLNEEEVVVNQTEENVPIVNYENNVISEPIMPDAQEIDMSSSVETKEDPVVPFIEPTITQSSEIGESIFPDFSEKEEVEVEPIMESSEPEEIEMPLPITESPELAFASLPTEDKTINENIKFESADEYDYEKTEIFDFPDFSKTEIDSEKMLVDVEKIVMEAANKYIDSVMKS